MDASSQKFFNFSEVTSEIEKRTQIRCGHGKEISHDPIKLRFTTPKLIDLQLVDLPGLTKNPVADQPKNIEEQIEQLILKYISNPNSIILAVSKGSDDLANSESLKLARKVDPKGERTIGVITQVDMMDSSTDITNDLLNKTYPLKLGYVGVVLKSPSDHEQNKDYEK
jgi:dynamin 1-like protein